MGIVVNIGFAVVASTPAERKVLKPTKIVHVKVAVCVEAVFIILVDPGRGLTDVVVAVVDVVDAVCVDVAVLARYRDVAVRLWSLSQPNQMKKTSMRRPSLKKERIY